MDNLNNLSDKYSNVVVKVNSNEFDGNNDPKGLIKYLFNNFDIDQIKIIPINEYKNDINFKVIYKYEENEFTKKFTLNTQIYQDFVNFVDVNRNEYNVTKIYEPGLRSTIAVSIEKIKTTKFKTDFFKENNTILFARSMNQYVNFVKSINSNDNNFLTIPDYVENFYIDKNAISTVEYDFILSSNLNKVKHLIYSENITCFVSAKSGKDAVAYLKSVLEENEISQFKYFVSIDNLNDIKIYKFIHNFVLEEVY